MVDRDAHVIAEELNVFGDHRAIDVCVRFTIALRLCDLFCFFYGID